jgi:hypothetical protein
VTPNGETETLFGLPEWLAKGLTWMTS